MTCRHALLDLLDNASIEVEADLGPNDRPLEIVTLRVSAGFLEDLCYEAGFGPRWDRSLKDWINSELMKET